MTSGEEYHDVKMSDLKDALACSQMRPDFGGSIHLEKALPLDDLEEVEVQGAM
jgi:hypothetical protein